MDFEIVSDPDSPHLEDPSDAGGSGSFYGNVGEGTRHRVLSPDDPIFRSRGCLDQERLQGCVTGDDEA